jgi:hypothetical protein
MNFCDSFLLMFGFSAVVDELHEKHKHDLRPCPVYCWGRIILPQQAAVLN